MHCNNICWYDKTIFQTQHCKITAVASISIKVINKIQFLTNINKMQNPVVDGKISII